MGDNIYTMTPGSAVADQLQEILARKRATARQSMLDALNQRNIESEMRARDERTQYEAESRHSLASERAAKELEYRSSRYSPHQNLAGSDLAFFQQNAPSMVDPAEGEQPQFDYEGQPAIPGHGPQFHGLPAQLQKEHEDQIRDRAIQRINSPEFAGMSPVEKEMLWREAYKATLPQGIAAPPDEQWAEVFDAEGNPTGNWAPKNAHFLSREPRQPQQPRSGVTRVEGYDDNQQPTFRVYSYEGSDITPKAEKDAHPTFHYAGPMGTAARDERRKPQRISDQTWKVWTGAYNAWAADKTNTDKTFKLTEQAKRVIEESEGGTHIKATLKDLVSKPERWGLYTPQSVAERIKAAGGSDRDQLDAYRIWSDLGLQ